MLEKREINKLNEEELKKKNKLAKKKKKKKVVEEDLELPKKKKKKKKNKSHPFFYKIIAFLLIVVTVITICYSVIEEIFSLYTMIPYILGGSFIVVLLTLLLTSRLRNWIKNIFTFLIFIIIILEILFMVYGVKTFKFINDITDTGIRVETYGIYVKKDSIYTNIKNLDNANLNYLYIPNDLETKETLEKAIDKNKIDFKLGSKDSLEELLKSINEDKAEAIFMNTSYETVAEEEYKVLFSNLVCIYTIEKVNKVKTTSSTKNVTKDTFAIYLSGIDTSGSVSSKARSDVNIIAIVNPTTHQILLINTPRDYYVPLASNGKYDKLTHAGLTSIEESANTLGTLYGVDIDYYARINFTSFIKIVDAIGGITVDVNKSFCEQDSKRDFDNQICLRAGLQNLNGEEALAYARHRKTLSQGDISRGENQMQIIEAIVDKVTSPAILKNYNNLINALSGNVITNMESEDMYSLAKYQLSKSPSWTFTSITATGEFGSKPCYALGNAYASVVLQDETSITGIKNAIKNIYSDKTEIIVEEMTNNN